jgi:hypothetical protein
LIFWFFCIKAKEQKKRNGLPPPTWKKRKRRSKSKGKESNDNYTDRRKSKKVIKIPTHHARRKTKEPG